MSRTLPDEFPPADKDYSLYEDVSYQNYWGNPKRGDQDALEQHIVSELLPTSGLRIVDIGGAYGRLTPCYVDRFEHAIICDGSMSLLKEARARWGDRITAVAADISLLPFKDGSFDCALMIRVLQHVHDLANVLGEVGRVIALDKTLVFSYHNKRNANRILRHSMAHGAANPFSTQPTELRATLISRHPRIVDTLVEEAGFTHPLYRGTALVSWLSRLSRGIARHTPAGARWAPFMGRFRLAPWLIGRSASRTGSELLVAESVRDILQCPVCREDVVVSNAGVECTACGRSYPVEEGVYDFRV